jgi:hypothetical protein
MPDRAVKRSTRRRPASGGDRRWGALKAGQGASLALASSSLGLIKDGWNGYNVVHFSASRAWAG